MRSGGRDRGGLPAPAAARAGRPAVRAFREGKGYMQGSEMDTNEASQE